MASTLSVCTHRDSLNRVEARAATEKKPTCGKCGRELPMHDLVSEVNARNFQRILAKADKPVIVDFWAAWCGPCKMYGPVFQRASKENTEAIFLKVDTEANSQLSQQLGIRGIPTTIVFEKGQEKVRQPGVLSQESISQILRS